MRIDVHAHFCPRKLGEELETLLGRPVAGFSQPESALTQMADEAREAGVDLQILSAGPIQPYHEQAAVAAAAAVAMNDLHDQVVADGQGRFAAFAALPLPHVELALAEVARCLDELSFAGFAVGCSVLGRSLADPGFDDLWHELDRRGAVVFVHPGGIFVGTEPPLAGMSAGSLAAITVGSSAETATAALALADVSLRWPQIKFIFAVTGGALSLVWERISELAGRHGPDDGGTALLSSLRGFFYDTSMLEQPLSLILARDTFGSGRLLLGSDAPRCGTAEVITFVNGSPGLSPTVQHSIIDANADFLIPYLPKSATAQQGGMR